VTKREEEKLRDAMQILSEYWDMSNSDSKIKLYELSSFVATLLFNVLDTINEEEKKILSRVEVKEIVSEFNYKVYDSVDRIIEKARNCNTHGCDSESDNTYMHNVDEHHNKDEDEDGDGDGDEGGDELIRTD